MRTYEVTRSHSREIDNFTASFVQEKDVKVMLAERRARARIPGNVDGMSMLRAMRGERQPTHEFLYWEFHERGF